MAWFLTALILAADASQMAAKSDVNQARTAASLALRCSAGALAYLPCSETMLADPPYPIRLYAVRSMRRMTRPAPIATIDRMDRKLLLE
jgi:hypothetical protein